MYVYIYIYLSIYIYIYTCICRYVFTCIYTHTNAHDVYMDIFTYIFVYIHTYIYIHAFCFHNVQAHSFQVQNDNQDIKRVMYGDTFQLSQKISQRFIFGGKPPPFMTQIQI